jgi:hypothetical protein
MLSSSFCFQFSGMIEADLVGDSRTKLRTEKDTTIEVLSEHSYLSSNREICRSGLALNNLSFL